MSSSSQIVYHTDNRPSVAGMIADVRHGNTSAVGDLLQLYRAYLTMLAAKQLSERMRRRVNPSDIVQETMLAAYRDFPSFRGGSEQELLGWLRQILANCVRHTVDVHINAQKRDMRRELTLTPTSRDQSSNGTTAGSFLVSHVNSPSTDCQQRELTARVATQLAKLRPDYREVIVLRNLKGLSFADIATRMERKVGTVRMLWVRAIAEFKSVCETID